MTLPPLPELTPAQWKALPLDERNRLRQLKHAHRRASEAAGPKPPPPPADPNATPFRTGDNRPLYLNGLWKNSSCFIILPGPSARTLDLSLLHRRGIFTLSVNNAPALFRPNGWIFVDPVLKFHNAIWFDPYILKFVHQKFLNHNLRIREKTADGKFVWAKNARGEHAKIGEVPGVVGIIRNAYFDPEKWLSEPSINWGNSQGSKKQNGWPHTLNVMFAVLKLAYAMGFRAVYLLGCDFDMSSGRAYAFDETKTAGAAAGNNVGYDKVATMLEVLHPYFESAGFHVFNCNPKSRLTVFPHVAYSEAIKAATGHVPQDPLDTVGWYDKKMG